ncbi:MAG: hypothetical protein ABI411_20370 [Tahibacter sp.]
MNTQNGFAKHSQTDAIAAMQRLAETQLSTGSRLAYVGLLLFASTMLAVVVSLWMTEPNLPARTQIAFALMSGIGIAWMGFAIWVLRHRRVMLAGHRQVAGRMAVFFTGLFVLGAGITAVLSRAPASIAALLAGLVMLGVAIAILRSASHQQSRLHARRDQLQRELDESL